MNKNEPEMVPDTEEMLLEETGPEEPAEPGEAAEQPAPELFETEVLTQKLDEQNDKYLRLMAEYDNFRKRTQKERGDAYSSATAGAVAKFLPVLDNFDRAAQFPRPDDDFGKGFDLIYQSLKETLAAMGVEEIGKPGEEFNPEYHNAVMHIEDEELGENVVAAVLQKGYKMGDKIIRYAMVQTAN